MIIVLFSPLTFVCVCVWVGGRTSLANLGATETIILDQRFPEKNSYKESVAMLKNVPTFQSHIDLQDCFNDSEDFLKLLKELDIIKSKVKLEIRLTHFRIWPLIPSYPFFLGYTVYVACFS